MSITKNTNLSGSNIILNLKASQLPNITIEGLLIGHTKQSYIILRKIKGLSFVHIIQKRSPIIESVHIEPNRKCRKSKMYYIV